MGFRLQSSPSKNAESFYIIQDFRSPDTGKRTTRIYKKLGTLTQLQMDLNLQSRDDVVAYLQNQIQNLRAEDAQQKQLISVELSPTKMIDMNAHRSFNTSCLFLQKILSMLDLKKICDSIAQEHRFGYSLFDLLSMLVTTRILYPGSKRSSLKDSEKIFDSPSGMMLSHIYRSLPLLAQNRYRIESALYDNSKKISKRDTSVLYYDCTNFYFEIEEEDEVRKYGKSKENRPNPIVQYGLFMDSNGIPLADLCFEGNSNEQKTLQMLENQIEKDFDVSRFVVCTDAGLNSFSNRIYNDKKKNGAYIVIQPIKTMTAAIKKWSTDPSGWRLLGSRKLYNLDELEETTLVNGKEVPTLTLTFYKDRWVKTTKKNPESGRKETLEEHLIVSYSLKYKRYQEYIREKKIERAEKLLKSPGKIDTSNPRNPRYYIKKIDYDDATGEVIEKWDYDLDQEKIDAEKKLDGFYAVLTDLEDDDISMVIQANKQRWEIEECFEIMKSELETRPVYVSRKEAIEGHLLICFIALLVYRILEQYLESKWTCREIIDTLRSFNITHLKGPYYIPGFKRTELTDQLTEIFDYQMQTEVITEKNLKKFSKNSKSKKITHFVKDKMSG